MKESIWFHIFNKKKKKKNHNSSPVHLMTRRISLIPWIQSSTVVESSLPAKEGRCIQLNYSTVQPTTILVWLQFGGICAIFSITCCVTAWITSETMELASSSKFDPFSSKRLWTQQRGSILNLDSVNRFNTILGW